MNQDNAVTEICDAVARLPPELDFTGMFHGVDERIPVDALRLGVRALVRFLDDC
ncbi:MAG: hypothetical protein ACRDPT_01600 [Streptomycetales bacterium]